MVVRSKIFETYLFDSKLIWKFVFLIWIIFLVIFYLTTRPRANQKIAKKESICFLLGEDIEGHDFYRLAEEHFRDDPESRVDKIVTHIRSLEELILYLNAFPTVKEYERIELVVHGNVWSGLSTKILDGGERAYPKELLKAVLKKELPALNSGIIDASSKINVWACGIGNNPLINIALDLIFRDTNGSQAKVSASQDFIVFKKVHPSLPAKKIKAQYWPYFFKRGYRPSESEIVQAFKEMYPSEKIEWELGLEKSGKAQSSKVYEESFHVPFTWTVLYKNKSDRPDLSSFDNKMNWIQSQPALLQKIKDFGIPLERYNWTVNKIIHTDDEGNKVPAIKAIGMSTVLCILQPEQENSRVDF